MAEHTILIIRHAEAGSTPPGLTDHARPLTDTGIRQAEAIGRLIAGGELPAPERVLASDATRTLQTWQLAATAAGLEVPADPLRVLYGAEPDQIIELIQLLPETVGTAAIVGHAPEVPSLAFGVRDTRPLTGRVPGWPPGCLGVIEIAGFWEEFPAGARLVAQRAIRGD